VSNETEPDWVKRVRETNKFHVNKIKDNSKWRLTHTAKALKRSLGSVSEDIMVCKWLRTHERQLIKFEYLGDAIEFIRSKKHELMVEE
jgi:hypothetical protein